MKFQRVKRDTKKKKKKKGPGHQAETGEGNKKNEREMVHFLQNTQTRGSPP